MFSVQKMAFSIETAQTVSRFESGLDAPGEHRGEVGHHWEISKNVRGKTTKRDETDTNPTCNGLGEKQPINAFIHDAGLREFQKSVP